MAKSRTRAKADKAESVGRKNLIINGGFDVWQRGTSQTTSGYGSADRWYANSGNTISLSKQTLTADETADLNGLTNYMRLVGTSTDGNRQFFQRIEGLQKFAGQTLTFSFYAKAAASFTTSIQYGLINAGTNTYSTFDTLEVGTTWARYSTTFTVPSMSSGYTLTNANTHLRMAFGLLEASYTFDITGVQLELGPVATDFEHRSYGEELALCQRYYQKSYSEGVNAGTVTTTGIYIHNGSTDGGSNQYETIVFPVTMRASPTITLYSSATGTAAKWMGQRNGSGGSNRTINAYGIGHKGCYVSIAMDAAWVVSQVYGQYIADAEL